MMFKRHKFLAGALFSIPGIISLMLHGYLGSFSRFIADDFCSVSTIQRLGFLRSIKFWYFAWNGRYANSFVDGLLNILGGNRMSYVVPFLLLIWLLVTIYAVAWTLPSELDWSKKMHLPIPISVLVVFCVLLLSPNVPQSLYWWGGMRAYTLSLVFLSLYVAVFQFFRQRVRVFRGWRYGYYLVSFLLSFFLAGFSETLSPTLVLAITGLVILGLWMNLFAFRSPAFYFLIAGLVGAIVGLIVLIVAPGNAIRQEYFHRSTIPATLNIALNAYWALLASWFSEVKGITGLLGIGLGGIWAGMQTQLSGKYDFRYGFIFILLGSLLAFCCFLPAAYSISAATPERALIIPIYFLIIGILVGSYFWGQGIYGRFGHVSYIKAGISTALFLLIMVASSLNVLSLYSSRPVFIQYAQQWDEMHAYILAEKDMGKTKVRIAAKQNWAGLGEPRNKPGFWLNACMTDYYGIQVLAAASGQP